MLTGHNDFVHTVESIGDGEVIISGSKDKTIRIWQKDGTENYVENSILLTDDSLESLKLSRNDRFVVGDTVHGNTIIWKREGGVFKAVHSAPGKLACFPEDFTYSVAVDQLSKN